VVSEGKSRLAETPGGGDRLCPNGFQPVGSALQLQTDQGWNMLGHSGRLDT
jgi:hypothetical protein